ncbi:hypothetical protein BH11ACT8_BH11ACT8_05620 [soil metagenome]
MKVQNPLKRNAAILAAAAIVGGLGIGGLVTANADSPSAGPKTGASTTDRGDGDGEVPDAQEQQSDGESNDDGTDVGKDADPNEPGHQDATDAGDAAEGASEANDPNEAPEADEAQADGESNDDATDVGPDADANEPGHQDASDNPGDPQD